MGIIYSGNCLDLQLDCGNIYKAFGDGIDGETCRRMYLQLTCNILAVSDNSVDGNAKMVSHLLICHALHQTDYHVALAVAQYICITVLINHIRQFLRYIALVDLLFKQSDCRYKYMVFDLGMLGKP